MEMSNILQKIDNIVQNGAREFHKWVQKTQEDEFKIRVYGVGIKRQQHKCDSSKEVIVFDIKGKRVEMDRKKSDKFEVKFQRNKKHGNMRVQEIIQNKFEQKSGSSEETTVEEDEQTIWETLGTVMIIGTAVTISGVDQEDLDQIESEVTTEVTTEVEAQV